MVFKRFSDDFKIDSKNIKYTPEGYMIVPAYLARDGIQEYLPEQGGKLYRRPEDVFNDESIGSLRGKSITMLHPTDETGDSVTINPENWKRFEIGQVLEPKRDGNKIKADIIIKDAAAIKDIEDKISANMPLEMSCGWNSNINLTAGMTPEGEKYDSHTASPVINNHVAIVPRGRAGKDVRMLIDAMDDITKKQEKQMVKVNFNDVILDVADESVAAVKELIKTNTETQAKLDAATAQIKKLETENAAKLDADEVELKAAEIAEVKALCDGMKLDSKAKLDEMKNAVVGAVLPDAKEKFVKGDPIYRGALWDAALTLAKKAVENNKIQLDGGKQDQAIEKNASLFEDVE